MSIVWKRPSTRLRHSLLVLLFTASCAAKANAAEWRHELVNQLGGGKYSSLQIDSAGNAHVSYVDEPNNLLKYSFWDRDLDRWFSTTVDRTGGFCSLVLDSGQRPHISYLDYGSGRLKYAYWDGASWQKQTLQINARQITFYTSIALDLKGNPSISYYEYWGAGEDYRLNLRAVSWNGQFWSVRTVDSTPGSGKFNSMASDAAGNLHVAYANVKSENASLRYARWNGTAWEVEVLEGGGASNFPVFSVATVVDREDNPHITYSDVRNRLVKYATRRGGKWQIQTVDSLIEVAYPDRNGIALDDQGNPYISYYDAGSGLLKMAHRRTDRWVTEIVDGDFAGFTNSLRIDRGVIWVTYADEHGARLKCARRPVDDGAPLSEKKATSLSGPGQGSGTE